MDTNEKGLVLAAGNDRLSKQLSNDEMDKLADFDPKLFAERLKKAKRVMTVTADALEMVSGETRRFLTFGITKMAVAAQGDTPAGVIPAVKLIGDDKKMYIAAHAVIVNSVRDLDPLTPIEIVAKGKPSGKRYYDYDVTILK